LGEIGLANLINGLKSAMIDRLRADTAFSLGVEGRIFVSEPRELPAAWIGATAFDAGDGAIDLVATIHVWISTGKEIASALVGAAQAAFVEPPAAGGISIISWRTAYREVRLDGEHSAYHGLARFRANARVTDHACLKIGRTSPDLDNDNRGQSAMIGRAWPTANVPMRVRPGR
jgi:hypothetical protein